MLSASVRSVCLRPFLHENPRPLFERAGLFCRRSVSVFVGCFRYGYNIRAIMHLPIFASEGFVPIYVVAGLPDELTFRFVRNSVEASPVIVTVMSYPIPWAFGRFFGSQTAVNKRFRQFIVGVCDYVFAYSRYFACILEPIFVTDYQFSVVGVFCFGYFTILEYSKLWTSRSCWSYSLQIRWMIWSSLSVIRSSKTFSRASSR